MLFSIGVFHWANTASGSSIKSAAYGRWMLAVWCWPLAIQFVYGPCRWFMIWWSHAWNCTKIFVPQFYLLSLLTLDAFYDLHKYRSGHSILGKWERGTEREREWHRERKGGVEWVVKSASKTCIYVKIFIYFLFAALNIFRTIFLDKH